jgi:hypothetical protein
MSHDGWRTYQCSRNAKKDGYCKQHHPDSVKARRKEAEKRWRNRVEEIAYRKNAAIRKALAGVIDGWNTGVTQWQKRHESIPTAFVELATRIDEAEKVLTWDGVV